MRIFIASAVGSKLSSHRFRANEVRFELWCGTSCYKHVMSGNERLKLKLDQALHWIWSWQLQLERLIESTRHQFGNFKEVEQWKAFSRGSFDEHMLVVTGWHMSRALENVQRQVPSIRALRSTDVQEELMARPPTGPMSAAASPTICWTPTPARSMTTSASTPSSGSSSEPMAGCAGSSRPATDRSSSFCWHRYCCAYAGT